MTTAPLVERLIPPVCDSDLWALARLLIDAVESGAAVSFLAPLTIEQAEDWWRQTLATALPRSIFLVTREDEEIVGTVQLHPAWAPNQPHRAEVVKLLVHRRSQGKGLANSLMEAIEEQARDAGFSLLTLDAKCGGAAEHLYRRRGWVAFGIVPKYALDPDGAPHDAVFFYKELGKE